MKAFLVDKSGYIILIALLLVVVGFFCFRHSASAKAEDFEIEGKIIALWNGNAPLEGLSERGRQPRLHAYEIGGADIAVIICPGGGYKGLTKGTRIVESLQYAGFSAFVLRYRIAPCDPYAPLTDVQRAIRLVRAMGYKHVGVMGFSAGGHLACTAATHWDTGNPNADDPIERQSSRPDFLVSCYGPVNFEQFPEQGSVINLLGDRRTDPELLRFFSADKNVTADTPPAYIWHGSADRKVSVKHSILLSKAYSEAGVPHVFRIFPDVGHGVVLAKGFSAANGWIEECIEFIWDVCSKG